MFRLALVLSLLASAAAQTCPSTTNKFSATGSTTLQPAATLWAAGYKKKCSTQTVTVSGGGSGTGAKNVCGGVSEIGMLSRDFKSTEATGSSGGGKYSCVGSSTTVLSCVVARDGISIITRKGGSAAACIAILKGLTSAQVASIFGSKGTVSKWSDLSKSCASNSITITGATPVVSGTGDFFLATMLPGDTLKSTIKATGDADSATIANVLSDVNAIGFVTYASYTKAGSTVAPVALDGLLPTPANIQGSYKLARPLFMAAVNDSSKLPYLKQFFNYAATAGDSLTTSAGEVPSTSKDKAACKSLMGY